MNRAWLFGPAPDLLFGCGLLYALIFVFHATTGGALRELVPMSLLPIGAVLLSSPHYGATLIRVYEERADRRAYSIFATWMTLVIAGAFVWGLRDVAVGSWIVTIYLTWSPWHYTAQNYGISSMFLRRRGVEADPLTRRLLRASFTASFAAAVLSMHGGSVPDYVPNGVTGETYRLISLGFGGVWLDRALAVISVGYAGLVVAAFVRLGRQADWRVLAPTAVIAGSQALWFSVPVLARQLGWLAHIEPFSPEHAQYAFLWIAMAHAIQYVWISTYYAVHADGGATRLGFFVRSLLAGIAIWTVPAVIFAPGLLGNLPYDLGLGILVASAVNIHHFMLDGVIWKLRHARVARVLFKRSGEPSRGPWSRRRRLAWTAVGLVGVASLGVALVGIVETEFGLVRAFARGDLARTEIAITRLALIGRDNATVRTDLALAYVRKKSYVLAEEHFRRSLALGASVEAWIGHGYTRGAQGDWRGAIASYGEALVLEPENAEATFQTGVAHAEIREFEPARAWLVRARGFGGETAAKAERWLARLPGEARVPEALEPARNRPRTR